MCIFRLDHLVLVDSLQYDDSHDDLFEREPYSVRLRPVGQGAIPILLYSSRGFFSISCGTYSFFF